mmetsp:Transcript_14608/g.42823  ORF Transcript_14608/g.42823 Transcript_14608/m.42823 type:complete len:509 (-) Transcript_14608:346-1872(-)
MTTTPGSEALFAAIFARGSIQGIGMAGINWAESRAIFESETRSIRRGILWSTRLLGRIAPLHVLLAALEGSAVYERPYHLQRHHGLIHGHHVPGVGDLEKAQIPRLLYESHGRNVIVVPQPPRVPGRDGPLARPAPGQLLQCHLVPDVVAHQVVHAIEEEEANGAVRLRPAAAAAVKVEYSRYLVHHPQPVLMGEGAVRRIGAIPEPLPRIRALGGVDRTQDLGLVISNIPASGVGGVAPPQVRLDQFVPGGEQSTLSPRQIFAHVVLARDGPARIAVAHPGNVVQQSEAHAAPVLSVVEVLEALLLQFVQVRLLGKSDEAVAVRGTGGGVLMIRVGPAVPDRGAAEVRQDAEGLAVAAASSSSVLRVAPIGLRLPRKDVIHHGGDVMTRVTLSGKVQRPPHPRRPVPIDRQERLPVKQEELLQSPDSPPRRSCSNPSSSCSSVPSRRADRRTAPTRGSGATSADSRPTSTADPRRRRRRSPPIRIGEVRSRGRIPPGWSIPDHRSAR